MSNFLKEKSNPELIERMAKAGGQGLTREDIQAQKVSYIYGSVNHESKITKAEVEAFVKQSQGI